MTKDEMYQLERSWWHRFLVYWGFRPREQWVYLWCPGCGHDLWGQKGAYKETADRGDTYIYECSCGTQTKWLPGPAWILLDDVRAPPG